MEGSVTFSSTNVNAHAPVPFQWGREFSKQTTTSVPYQKFL